MGRNAFLHKGPRPKSQHPASQIADDASNNNNKDKTLYVYTTIMVVFEFLPAGRAVNPSFHVRECRVEGDRVLGFGVE